MKSTIKNFLFTATMLCLFSFTQTTTFAASMPTGTEHADKPVGGAYLLFAGKYGGNITKKELEGKTQLGVEGCAKGSRIFQFTLVVTKGGKTTHLKASSNTLTTEMVTKLKSLSAGDSFEFRDVKAYMAPNNDTVHVRADKFTIA